VIRVLDVEEYVRRTEAILEKEDFWESEKERTTDTSGNLVHAFSVMSRAIRRRDSLSDGVNSIQLFRTGPAGGSYRNVEQHAMTVRPAPGQDRFTVRPCRRIRIVPDGSASGCLHLHGKANRRLSAVRIGDAIRTS